MQNKIRIGKILKPHALKGEVKIYPYTNDIASFKNYKNIYVENLDTPYSLEYIKSQNNLIIAKFNAIDSIEELQSILGKYIFIDYSEKRKLDKDEYLISELIGLEVYSHDVFIGVVDDVLQYGANDVFRVLSSSKEERLIPNVKEFIKEIDIQNRKILVKLIEGM